MQFTEQMGYKRKLICWAYSSKTGRYWVAYFLHGVWCWKLILRKHAENCLNKRIESHVDMYSLVVCSINSSICMISWMNWCKLPNPSYGFVLIYNSMIWLFVSQYLFQGSVWKCNPWNHQLHHFCLSFPRLVSHKTWPCFKGSQVKDPISSWDVSWIFLCVDVFWGGKSWKQPVDVMWDWGEMLRC